MNSFTYLPLNSLEKVEINKVSNLVAMGLKEQFVSYRAHCIANETKELIGASPQEWLHVAESLTEPFERRLAAGRLLALVGDPRIRVLDPQMVTVPASVVSIGRSETEAQLASER